MPEKILGIWLNVILELIELKPRIPYSGKNRVTSLWGVVGVVVSVGATINLAVLLKLQSKRRSSQPMEVI